MSRRRTHPPLRRYARRRELPLPSVRTDTRFHSTDVSVERDVDIGELDLGFNLGAPIAKGWPVIGKALLLQSTYTDHMILLHLANQRHHREYLGITIITLFHVDAL